MNEIEEIVDILSQKAIVQLLKLPTRFDTTAPIERCVICQSEQNCFAAVLRDSASIDTSFVICWTCIHNVFHLAFNGRVGKKFTGSPGPLSPMWDKPLDIPTLHEIIVGEPVKKKKEMKAVFDKVSVDDIPANDDELLEKLREVSPGFTKRLASFLSGEVRFDDGSEHEFLASVSQQVLDKCRVPSPAQIEGFNKVYDTLLRKKAAGGVLHKESSDEHDLRLTASKKLLAIGCKRLHMFTPKTREIIESMDTQFKRKGELSVAQIKYLRMIVEQLPAAMLTLEDGEGEPTSWADTKGY